MGDTKVEVTRSNISVSTGTDTQQTESPKYSVPSFLFNNAEITGAKAYTLNGQTPEEAGVKGSVNEPLFAVKNEQQTQKPASINTEGLPSVNKTGLLAQWGNYLNRIRYGVDRLDTAIDDRALDVLQKYGIPESELKNIYDSNPRLQAIVYQMLQAGANYGIQTA